MPLYLLQGAGFAAGFATSMYAGYALLVDPVLVARYRHLSLLREMEGQLAVEESRMTAELNQLDARVRARIALDGK